MKATLLLPLRVPTARNVTEPEQHFWMKAWSKNLNEYFSWVQVLRRTGVRLGCLKVLALGGERLATGSRNHGCPLTLVKAAGANSTESHGTYATFLRESAEQEPR